MQKKWIAGTGFSRGIGFEFAKQIQTRNEKIFHIGRTSCGFEDEFFMCDLSKPLSMECMQSLHAKLQNKNISGFFYGAGLFPLLTYKENDFTQKEKFWESQRKAMQINYLSCAQLIEEILPLILNHTDTTPFMGYLSSLAAVDPLPGFEFYGITKMAALKYFQNLSKRFDANRLLCLSIHPGTVKTDMIEGIMTSQDNQDLPVLAVLKNALKEKQMLSAKESAQCIADFLFDPKYSEMRQSSHGQLFLADKKRIFS